jgi:hypothetical protein
VRSCDTPVGLVILTLALLPLTAGCSANDTRAGAERSSPETTTAAAPNGVLATTLVAELDRRELSPEPIGGGGASVPIGIFLGVRGSGGGDAAVQDAERLVRAAILNANAILAQCELSLSVEAAQLVRLPSQLMRFDGNDEASFGGHPPVGTADPALFNYLQGERLADDARELFAYGARHTSPNSIAVFTVGELVYYASQEITEASGLSFPPNVFHHEDDYPLRNSVVLAPHYLPEQPLPARISATTLAHELGHMLLNTGLHAADRRNLMGEARGTLLTAGQCDRMRENRARLYGAERIVDPGPP